MRHLLGRSLLILVLIVAGLALNGDFLSTSGNSFVTIAEARVGRPATPVSYAGVARRTTVRVATPEVGAPGVGARPANRGGPVNRVGRR